jgi:hypothetical protein
VNDDEKRAKCQINSDGTDGNFWADRFLGLGNRSSGSSGGNDSSELGVGSKCGAAKALVADGGSISSDGKDGNELGVGRSSGGNAGMVLALRGSPGGKDDQEGDVGSGFDGKDDQEADKAGDEPGIILFENPNCQLPKFGEPYCTKCGYVVDPITKGVRLLKKTPPTFECSQCNSKSTMLHRMLGSWPMQEFKELGLEEQQAFWRSSSSSKEGLKRSVEQHLLSRLVEVQCAKDAGPFLPLSVWSKQGYDVEDIKARALVEHHPVLGLTCQAKMPARAAKRNTK